MNGNWSSSLTLFAKNPKPASLPAAVYLRHDEHTLTIYDGFPKAKYHFLVLPRIPFKLDSIESSKDSTLVDPPKLGLASGKLSLGTSSSQSKVPDSHLCSLNDLLASPYAGQVLDKLSSASHEVVKLVKEEMRATTKGVEWGVRVGFHAVPSMETVHVHVISDDLVSDRLKNKKHYQSFHPSHGFWLDMKEVQDLVRRGEKKLLHPARHYESLLKSTLISFRDDHEYANIPKLKEHLEQAWISEIKAKERAGEDRTKRKLDEEPNENGSKKLHGTESLASSSDTESDR